MVSSDSGNGLQPHGFLALLAKPHQGGSLRAVEGDPEKERPGECKLQDTGDGWAIRPRVAGVHIPSLNHGRKPHSTTFQTDSAGSGAPPQLRKSRCPSCPGRN